VVAKTVEGCLQEHVQAEYDGVCRDYVGRSQQGSDELLQFMGSCEEVMRRGLGLRPLNNKDGMEAQPAGLAA